MGLITSSRGFVLNGEGKGLGLKGNAALVLLRRTQRGHKMDRGERLSVSKHVAVVCEDPSYTSVSVLLYGFFSTPYQWCSTTVDWRSVFVLAAGYH